jgi:hypothetical protein
MYGLFGFVNRGVASTGATYSIYGLVPFDSDQDDEPAVGAWIIWRTDGSFTTWAVNG